MAGVNKVIIVGNLGKDPELRHTPQGMAVASFPVATSESWNSKDGQKQSRTEWHRIVAWGKLGELCSKYLAKGRQAYVEGRMQTRSWEDKEGQKRYTTEVVATTVQFLGGSAGAGAGASNFDNSGGGASNNNFNDDPFGDPPSFDSGTDAGADEIPF